MMNSFLWSQIKYDLSTLIHCNIIRRRHNILDIILFSKFTSHRLVLYTCCLLSHRNKLANGCPQNFSDLRCNCETTANCHSKTIARTTRWRRWWCVDRGRKLSTERAPLDWIEKAGARHHKSAHSRSRTIKYCFNHSLKVREARDRQKVRCDVQQTASCSWLAVNDAFLHNKYIKNKNERKYSSTRTETAAVWTSCLCCCFEPFSKGRARVKQTVLQ